MTRLVLTTADIRLNPPRPPPAPRWTCRAEPGYVRGQGRPRGAVRERYADRRANRRHRGREGLRLQRLPQVERRGRPARAPLPRDRFGAGHRGDARGQRGRDDDAGEAAAHGHHRHDAADRPVYLDRPDHRDQDDGRHGYDAEHPRPAPRSPDRRRHVQPERAEGGVGPHDQRHRAEHRKRRRERRLGPRDPPRRRVGEGAPRVPRDPRRGRDDDPVVAGDDPLRQQPHGGRDRDDRQRLESGQQRSPSIRHGGDRAHSTRTADPSAK